MTTIGVEIKSSRCNCCGNETDCLIIAATYSEEWYRFCNPCWNYIKEVATRVAQEFTAEKLLK